MSHLRAGAALLLALTCTGRVADPPRPKPLIPETPQAPVNRWSRLGIDLEHARRALRIDGLAAIVVEDGRIAWRQGFGDLSPCHRLNVASITKTMGAVLALQELDAGRLRLDDRVPGLPNVTVRHILSHTSRPSRKFQYDNQRYGLLTKILERRAGESLPVLLRERVFAPGGLATASPSRSVVGGVRASADDLARYAIALDGDALASPQAKRLMWTRVRANVPYGLGWFVERRDGLTVAWHYGRVSDASSLLVKIPELRLSLVVLANSPALGGVFRMANLALSPVGASFLESSLAHVPDDRGDDELLEHLPTAVAQAFPDRR